MITPPRFNEPPDWDAIARHRAGESEGEEARRVAEWLAAHPQDAEVLAALDGALAGGVDASAPRADEPDVEAALRAVHARMHHDSPARVLPFRRRRRATASRGRIVRWLAGGIAAAAAIGALVLGLGRTRDAGEHGRLLAAGGAITTAVGVRDSVRLPDGTRVILGPASRLAVSPSYGRDARHVTVDGTAWFAVRHLPTPTFTVRAGPATVSDVGTEFTVRTDDVDGASAVTVAVTEGEVLLHPENASKSSITLKAGDRGGVRSDRDRKSVV
jgi:transmembrane sensor